MLKLRPSLEAGDIERNAVSGRGLGNLRYGLAEPREKLREVKTLEPQGRPIGGELLQHLHGHVVSNGDGEHGEFSRFHHCRYATGLLFEYRGGFSAGSAVRHEDEPWLVIVHAVFAVLLFATFEAVERELDGAAHGCSAARS